VGKHSDHGRELGSREAGPCSGAEDVNAEHSWEGVGLAQEAAVSLKKA